jgi:TDG/mug DNA glycosylase family protein
VLPDLLAPGLDVVFCGTSVGDRSASIGHYYAGAGNDFWSLLAEAGITPERLVPESDASVFDLGVGLTDLVKLVASSSDSKLRKNDFDVPGFERKIAAHCPRWVAFHGKGAARAYRGVSSGTSQPLGVQRWAVADTNVFVVPSTSGSNRRSSYDGRATRLEWFETLRDAVWPNGRSAV